MASDGSDARPGVEPKGEPPHSVVDSCQEVAQLLGIAAPEGASNLEQAQWLRWWEASAQAARSMSAETIATLKAARWWPPVTAHQIEATAPVIVLRTLRPGLSGVLTADVQSPTENDTSASIP